MFHFNVILTFPPCFLSPSLQLAWHPPPPYLHSVHWHHELKLPWNFHLYINICSAMTKEAINFYITVICNNDSTIWNNNVTTHSTVHTGGSRQLFFGGNLVSESWLLIKKSCWAGEGVRSAGKSCWVGVHSEHLLSCLPSFYHRCRK